MNSKVSDFQKKIEAIENVILCVSEAENLVNGIGMKMISRSQLATLRERHKKARFSLSPICRGGSRTFSGQLPSSGRQP
jgi:hypothetical protein